MSRSLAPLLALALAACAAPSGSVEVVGPDAVASPDGRWLDLTDPTRAYVVAPEVDLADLVLVCPDGSVMRGDDWAAANPEVTAGDGVLAIALDPALAAEAVTDCENTCARCADGVTVCSAPDLACVGGAYEEERWGPGSVPTDDPAPESGASEPPRDSGGGSSSGGSSGSASGGGAPSGGASPGARPG